MTWIMSLSTTNSAIPAIKIIFGIVCCGAKRRQRNMPADNINYPPVFVLAKNYGIIINKFKVKSAKFKAEIKIKCLF
jgi:hypothetical protein